MKNLACVEHNLNDDKGQSCNDKGMTWMVYLPFFTWQWWNFFTGGGEINLHDVESYYWLYSVKSI